MTRVVVVLIHMCGLRTSCRSVNLRRSLLCRVSNPTIYEDRQRRSLRVPEP